jgi:hypothetical protein
MDAKGLAEKMKAVDILDRSAKGTKFQIIFE